MHFDQLAIEKFLKQLMQNGTTAVSAAGYQGEFVILKYLIEQCKANIDLVDEVREQIYQFNKMHLPLYIQTGANILMTVVVQGHPKIVAYLIETCKMDPNSCNKVTIISISVLFPN